MEPQSSPPGPSRGVRCPRHGLWYDASATSRCSRCDAEAASQSSTRVPWGLAGGLVLLGACLVTWTQRARLFERMVKQDPVESAGGVASPSEAKPSAGEPVKPSAREITYQVDGSPRRALVYGEEWPEPRPLVLAADPGGRHDASMMRLLPAARAVRWIVATTPVVRNGTADTQDSRELAILRNEVERLFRVDRARIVLEGWSGTGCGAYAQILMNGSVYRGAIVENAHMGSWREYGKLAPAGKVVYLFTRTDDFNAPHTRTLRDTMRAAGFTVEYEELPGAHVPLGPEEMLRAVRWMDARL